MKITIDSKAKKMIIECDIDVPPKPSNSGKMMLLASTGGFASTSTEFEGKPVKINMNVGIPTR